MRWNRNWAVSIVAFGITTSCWADEKTAEPVVHEEQAIEAVVENDISLVTRSQVEKALLLPWPDIAIQGEPSLAHILQDLETYLTQTSKHPITFVIDHRELELEAIDSLEELEVKEIDIRPGTHTCEQVLDLIWSQLDVGLVGIPMDGHILITSVEKSTQMLENRFYDLTGLMLIEPSADNSDIADTTSQQATNRQKRRAGRKNKDVVVDENNSTASSSPGVLKQFGGGGLGGGGLGGGKTANRGTQSESSNPAYSMVVLITAANQPERLV